MKITHIKTRALQTPTDSPLVWRAAGDAKFHWVTVEIGTDEGVEGIGFTFFGGVLNAALKAAVDALGALCIGENPLQNEAICAKLHKAASGAGPGGLFSLALAAIDIALWDIKGKAANQSVCDLIGGFRQRAPTYASGALLRPFPVEYLAIAGPKLVEMGFKAMKMQCGAESSLAREVERVRVMRESVGDGIDLMCDINQLWNVNQAITVGKHIEPYGLFWLEDPIAHDDTAGLARIADALTTALAAGEYCYGITPFRHLLEARAIDIVMVDTLRAGGITQFLKIAGMAAAFNLPVVSHLAPEINVHLIAGIPNGLTVEYMPWSLRLFEETPKLEDGQILVPQSPGLGLKFDQDALRRFEVA